VHYFTKKYNIVILNQLVMIFE